MAKSIEKMLKAREQALFDEMLSFYEECALRYDLIDEKKSIEYKERAVELKLLLFKNKLKNMEVL